MSIYSNISLKFTVVNLQLSAIGGNHCMIIGSAIGSYLSTVYPQTSKIRLRIAGNVCNTSYQLCTRGSLHHNTWRICTFGFCAFILNFNCTTMNVQRASRRHFNNATYTRSFGCVPDHRSTRLETQLPFVRWNTKHYSTTKRFAVQLHVECVPAGRVFVVDRSNLCILEHGKPAILGF